MIADTVQMRPKQIAGSLAIQRGRNKLLADQPGAGKTLQMLFAAELDGLFDRRSNILIASTMTACQLTWAAELQKRIASQYEVVIADLTDTNGKKTLPSLQKRNDRLATALIEANENNLPLIVLTNFESLRWPFGTAPKLDVLWSIEFDMVALDESHLVLPTQTDKPSEMTQFWYGLSALRYRERLCRICGEPHDPTDHDDDEGRLEWRPYQAMRLAMSGTPDRGKLENRYGTWKWLFPNQYVDYWGWLRGQFFVHNVERGRNPRTGKPYVIPEVGKLQRPEVWAQFDAGHMIRRTKAEMLDGMPAKFWPEDGGVDLPMTPTQRDAYLDYQAELEDMEAEAIANEEHGRASALKLQFALRARQMASATWSIEKVIGDDGLEHTTGKPIVLGRAGSNKLDWTLGFLESRGFTADNWDPTLGKVVIVSYFNEVLEWLKVELAAEGIHAEVMKGSQPLENKRIEQEFQEGELRLVLLQGALGVSINLDAADDMVFFDMVHDPDRIEQAEDRIHRASRMHHAFYWRLISKDSIDVATVEVVDARYKMTRASYEGQRGIEFARRMLSGGPREGARA